MHRRVRSAATRPRCRKPSCRAQGDRGGNAGNRAIARDANDESGRRKSHHLCGKISRAFRARKHAARFQGIPPQICRRSIADNDRVEANMQGRQLSCGVTRIFAMIVRAVGDENDRALTAVRKQSRRRQQPVTDCGLTVRSRNSCQPRGYCAPVGGQRDNALRLSGKRYETDPRSRRRRAHKRTNRADGSLRSRGTDVAPVHRAGCIEAESYCGSARHTYPHARTRSGREEQRECGGASQIEHGIRPLRRSQRGGHKSQIRIRVRAAAPKRKSCALSEERGRQTKGREKGERRMREGHAAPNARNTAAPLSPSGNVAARQPDRRRRARTIRSRSRAAS